MDALGCAGSEFCRQYCEALRSQRVAVVYDKAGCNVPAMFTIKTTGIDFDPKPVEDAIRNTELVNYIGGTLCGVLIERTGKSPELQAVVKLKAAYGQAFKARLELWQCMLEATYEGRSFTDAELEYYQAKVDDSGNAVRLRAANALPEIVLRAQAAADRATVDEHGLLFDDQIISVTDRLVGNLIDGTPMLLVGDKGIAKTQAAKFVAKLWDSDTEPVIISGHGDMMSNEFIGQMEQDKDTGMFAFKEGGLVQAMREGRPVILDEVNVGDQAVFMRLQDLLLRRPGQSVRLQETDGGSFEIPPGFVVLATANEASVRYKHRNVLDPAFRDRYDVLLLQYPDSDSDKSPLVEVPSSLMRLALAAAVDEKGVISKHINTADLECLVRLAYVTQHLYSVPSHNSRVSITEGNSTSAFLDDEPAMTDCITPRALAETVKRCAPGNKPGLTLASEMERLIKGLDRAGSTHNQGYARRALTLLKASL